MATFTLASLHRFEFAKHVTFLQADLQRPVLLANVGNDSLCAIDIDRMLVHPIDLKPLVDEFLIYSWTMDLDGRCSLLASSDPVDFGIALDHQTWSPLRFRLPEGVDLLAAACWTQPRFAAMDSTGKVWNAVNAELVELPQDPAEERRNAVYARLFARSSVFSFDGENGLACLAAGEGDLGVAAPPDWDVKVMGAMTGQETAAAHHRGHMFVSYADRIDVLTGGRRATALSPEAGRKFFRVAIGPWRGGTYLAALSGAIADRRTPFWIDVYDLRVGASPTGSPTTR